VGCDPETGQTWLREGRTQARNPLGKSWKTSEEQVQRIVEAAIYYKYYF